MIREATLALLLVVACAAAPDKKPWCDNTNEFIKEVTDIAISVGSRVRVLSSGWGKILTNLEGIVIAKWTLNKRAQTLTDILESYDVNLQNLDFRVAAVVQTFDVLKFELGHLVDSDDAAEVLAIQLWHLITSDAFQKSDIASQKISVTNFLTSSC